MRKRYLIKIDDNRQSDIYCPPSLLKNGPLTKISFGSLSVEANFLAHPEENEKIVMGRKIFESIHFPDFQVPLHVFITQQTLFIGPLIGIFTAGFTPFPLRPIGERSMFFSKLLSVKKTVGALPFLFGEQHIDWENGLIKGYFFHEDGWEIRNVPFPNVIYDRLPNRKTENNSTLKKVKERLQKDYLIPWYNPGFFNKLDVHEKLM
ncbi:MAG: YheC/YheD family protein, partial [Bacillota bacterium]|nr:YheC/YheD family protein [Bacillota bacterium]